MSWSLEEAIAYYKSQGAPGNQNALISLLKEAQLENGGSIPAGTKAVCIGSSTAKMLKKYGDYEKITAETFNVDGVVEIILKEVAK